jgi:hypothetical protein
MGDGGIAGAFELIGHPDRLSILSVLIEARRGEGQNHVRFTDLRDRSDISDTGRFNYHLGQLEGTFVTKTTDGYRLSSYGRRILAPMMGGLYDPTTSPEPFETPGECPECGGTLQIRPDETVLQLVCEQGHLLYEGLFGYTGAITDRPATEASEALGLINVQGVELAISGICPTCHGTVDGEMTLFEDTEYYAFEAPCSECGNQFACPVGACTLTHPVVVAFLYDHDIDVRRCVPWSFPFVYRGHEQVESTDPLRLLVKIPMGDESLAVTMARDGSVVSTERSEVS